MSRAGAAQVNPADHVPTTFFELAKIAYVDGLLVTRNQSKLHLFFFCHKCRSLTNGWQAGGRHRSE